MMKDFLKSRTIQAALLTGTIALIIAAVTWLNPLEPVAALLLDRLSIEVHDPVRKLEPIETGIYIGDLPDGVYGFANINMIHYEIQEAKPHWKMLKVSNKKDLFDFELQVHDGNQYVIGFIGSESFSKIDDVNKENPIFISLFPYSWTTETNPVEIPLDGIQKIDIRPVNATDKLTIYALDMEVSAIDKAISTHKK